MALRTSTLFAALGQEGALEVVLLLLHEAEGASVGMLVSDLDLSQASVSRRLEELESAGLVEHERRGRPFRLREPDLVTELLVKASEVSERLLALDSEAERAFRDRLGSTS